MDTIVKPKKCGKMNDMETDEKSYSKPLVFSALIVIFLLIAYCAYNFILLRNELAITKTNLAITTTQCESQIKTLDQNAQDLQKNLAQSNEDAKNLNEILAEKNIALTIEQEKNNAFEKQLTAFGKTVGKLEKLSQTDKELLQKYSKIYFLSENYIPSALSALPVEYLQDKTKITSIHTNVLPFSEQLFEAASSSGISLKVISAYRSFGEQTALKKDYKLTYGYGANQFSADQGYSEHQLGTTLDLTTSKLGISFTKFDTDTAYTWMTDNAYKYGFTLSFPKGNAYYQYEPWHWRFVGVSLATKLHTENKHFYDLEQRVIDTYLISIFDSSYFQ